MRNIFGDLFPEDKALIGMIHLAGDGCVEKLKRVIKELKIYEDNGFNGAIIENYCGSVSHLDHVLRELDRDKFNLIIGSNILGNTYLPENFIKAEYYKVPFIQVDSVHPKDIPFSVYDNLRNRHSNVSVLGGINFKYRTQEKGEDLKRELNRAMGRCEGIVTTGEGTGIETPLEKLLEMRDIIGDFPLISGAGVHKNNVYETSRIVDGIIIGSYVKDYDLDAEVIPKRCEDISKIFWS